MTFDKNMLTPRGLLVNSHFVCQGTSFSSLIVAINNMMSVPHTKEQLVEFFRFSDAGANEASGTDADAGEQLLDILQDMLILMDKVYYQSMSRPSGYHDVGDVCDRILVLSAAAPNDYNEIFDGLERLYRDEADNTELRNAIKAKIDARLADIRAASSSSTATRKVLADSTDAVELAQGQLQQISQQLNGDEIYAQILQKFIPDWVQISLNVAAVNFMRGWIAQLRLTDETASSLQELQKAVGGISEIDMDLVSLRKYIEENTEPGPNPILDLQKGNILEMWDELDKEVRVFKAKFVDTF
ncbi:hypothetical protein E4U41_004927 [Claviceps citrina]|nr:hypothetical protein E4U41_004927 [Claviceps citrina]